MTVILTSRRSLIKGLTSLVVAAPVIIRPENLMRIDNPLNRLTVVYCHLDGKYESIVNYLPGNNIGAKLIEARNYYMNQYEIVRKAEMAGTIYVGKEEVRQALAFHYRTRPIEPGQRRLYFPTNPTNWKFS